MNTELEGVQDLLEELDPKNLFGNLEWDIINNSERNDIASKYLDDPVTRALKEDKTIRVKGMTRADKYRRWAKANGRTLTVRHRGEYTFLWLVKEDEKSEDKSKES